jgi:hypothetical protein
MRTPQELNEMQTGAVKRERALLLVEHVIRGLDDSQRE